MSAPPLQLEIEKLVYGGDGLARLPADARGRRMACLAPFTLPGETVLAEVITQKGGLARAEARGVLQASAERVAPPCPYFGACGGCHLQHGSYKLQLQAKSATLRETLFRAGLRQTPEIQSISGPPWGYRNRVRLHVRAGPPWQLGYLQRKSHKLLAVGECPIAAPLLQRALAALQTPQLAAWAPPEMSQLELFCNHDQSLLLVTGWSETAMLEEKSAARWLASCCEVLPELVAAPHLVYRVADEDYRVSAGAFFQTNLRLLDSLAEAVCAAIPDTSLAEVLDLYAGVGLFARRLARRGATVTAVESSPASAADLKHNLRQFPQAQALALRVESFLAQTSIRPTAALVDPPRAGLGEPVAHALARLAAPVLVYLSCDPATLARDLKVLLGGGYTLTNLQMIDLFPQTFHIETLAVLRHN